MKKPKPLKADTSLTTSLDVNNGSVYNVPMVNTSPLPLKTPQNAESIQAILDDNALLLKTALEYQNLGRVLEESHYLTRIHSNLILLTGLADRVIQQNKLKSHVDEAVLSLKLQKDSKTYSRKSSQRLKDAAFGSNASLQSYPSDPSSLIKQFKSEDGSNNSSEEDVKDPLFTSNIGDLSGSPKHQPLVFPAKGVDMDCMDMPLIC